MRSFLIRFTLATLCGLALHCHAQHPTSKRAQAAIERVTPALTAALEEKGLKLGSPLFIRIFKASSELEVWLQAGHSFKLFKTYRICYFSGTPGPKRREGDQQSPEGFYRVTARQLNPYSRFHLSFNLGYPNAYDRAHGRTGAALMVHGNCVSIGCYAMTDPYIEEIYTLADAALRGGQSAFQVDAFPFRMTAENLDRHKDSVWYRFWQNLQEGYQYFEENKIPARVTVKNKSYAFE